MQDQSKVMFVHIPRTAGSSINEFIRQKYPANLLPKRKPLFKHHDPYFHLALKNNLSEFYKFAVVRNPYQRAYSHYKAFLLQLNHIGLESLSNSFSFNDFLKYKRTSGDALFSSITFNRNTFSVFDQLFYLLDDFGEISLDKIYRFEHLEEFETDFNTKIERINASVYIGDEYVRAFDKANIGLVKTLYHRDFSLLNYSTHFDDSIK